MSHKQQREFVEYVKRIFPYHFESTHNKVLEIGSRNVNGSCREFFGSKDYIGLDLSEGPGVDVICHAADYNGAVDSFDVIISCEALEHDRRWEDTLLSAYRMLKPGGLLVVTCAGLKRGEHGTIRTTPKDSPATTDYYRNLSCADIMSPFGQIVGDVFKQYESKEGWDGKDTYFWWIK